MSVLPPGNFFLVRIFLFHYPTLTTERSQAGRNSTQAVKDLVCILRVHRTERIPVNTARHCLWLNPLILWLWCPNIEKCKQLYKQDPFHTFYPAKGRSTPCPILPHLSRVWVQKTGRILCTSINPMMYPRQLSLLEVNQCQWKNCRQ